MTTIMLRINSNHSSLIYIYIYTCLLVYIPHHFHHFMHHAWSARRSPSYRRWSLGLPPVQWWWWQWCHAACLWDVRNTRSRCLAQAILNLHQMCQMEHWAQTCWSTWSFRTPAAYFLLHCDATCWFWWHLVWVRHQEVLLSMLSIIVPFW